MTGTDGAKPDKVVRMGVVPGVVEGGIRLHRTALLCTTGPSGTKTDDAPKTPEMKRPGAVLHRAASNCTSEPGGTRTLDPRINLPHGLSPAVLRCGLDFTISLGFATGGEPLVKSLRIPTAIGRPFLLIAQSAGLSRSLASDSYRRLSGCSSIWSGSTSGLPARALLFKVRCSTN